MPNINKDLEQLKELVAAGELICPDHHKIIDGDLYYKGDEPDMGEVYWPVELGSEYDTFITRAANSRAALSRLVSLLEEIEGLDTALHVSGVMVDDGLIMCGSEDNADKILNAAKRFQQMRGA